MISARVHYASLALIELASRVDEKAPVAASEITKRHGVPGPFLVQILRALRSAGWVQSIRGSQGGYRLLVQPSELTLLDIAEAVGCPDAACQSETTDSEADKQLRGCWEKAAEASRAVLAETTLADIVTRSEPADEVMFYI